jgi:uncharacterized membrane protein (DUF373 family)
MPPRASLTFDARLGTLERAIYLVVAVLLVVAAVLAIVGTIQDLIEGSDSRAVADTAVFVLERVLLLFIIAELLHTLRLIGAGGKVLVEPFLFIGLIAVVRRILVVTAEAEGVHGRRDTTDFLLQLGALGALALVLALAIHLLRGSSADAER